MILIGHRGAKGHLAENTLASFEKALQLNVDMIELDVFLSRDNIPVVIHDKTIDRTTSGFGLVSSFSARELREFGIPTLQDVFQLVNNQCDINIEVKEIKAVKSILDLIDSNIFSKDKLLISRLDWNALQEVRFHDDEIRIGVLTETDLELAIAFAKFMQAYSIHPHYKLLNKENVAQMQSQNFKVFPWTVNDQTDITFVKFLNVDGIITDYPDRI